VARSDWTGDAGKFAGTQSAVRALPVSQRRYSGLGLRLSHAVINGLIKQGGTVLRAYIDVM